MGGWGGYQRENFYQESNWVNSRSKYRKPSLGSWQPTVPSWEKKFCSSVCLIPWRKICEAKRVMNLYTNIVQWDDSAGEEAFQNAKTRFWAEINGLPCDISMPDPDIYIDNVDWDSHTDPELLSDLDREPPVPVDDEDGKLGFLDYALSNRPVVCTGWDDADDPVMVGTICGNHDKLADNNDLWGQSVVENRVAEGNFWGSGWGDHNKKINNSVSAWESGPAENRVPVNNLSNNGWGLWESYDRNADDNSNVKGHCGEENRVAEGNSWESVQGDCNRIALGHNSWNTESRVQENSSLESGRGDRNKIASGHNAWDNGDRENRVSEDNVWDNGWGQWENVGKVMNSEFKKHVGGWRIGDGNYRKRERGGRRVPRYNDNTPKFQGDYCQMNGGWRNGKGRKRVSFVHERPVINKRSLAPWQWNSIKSCGPTYHDKSAQSGNSWSWEKPVS